MIDIVRIIIISPNAMLNIITIVRARLFFSSSINLLSKKFLIPI
ncbi:hypothetical protein BSV1_0082 [Borreliella finlandensis]|uniref:Uncharacterized protein n=1 Tax=Borreliella finlandensis TaxID=498741 RepID=A0A826GV98_9SPIR|nr:hypothetical protein BSV1_0082 [Borreliella finlandensis]